MIVDTHVHVWEMPPVAPVGPTAPSFTAVPDAAGPVELLLDDMDANGVGAAVLVQTSWSTWDNTYVARAAADSSRLCAIGLIDPLDHGNAQKVATWMDRFAMRGFRLHPDYYPDVEILTRPHNVALFKEIEARSGIVKVHNRVPNAHQLDAVAGWYPGITWIIDHLMYPEPAMAATDWHDYAPVLALARHPNARLTISDVHSRSDVGFPYRDMHEVVGRAIDAFGIERCLWGTGYPGYHREAHGWPSLADELRLVREGFDWLSADERRLLLGENARKLFEFG